MNNANLTSLTPEKTIPWQDRILTRSLFLFMSISLLPLLLVGIVTTYHIGKDARQKAENALLVSAADLAGRTEDYFTLLTDNMKFIASHLDRKNLRGRDNIRFLSAFAVEHDDIQTIWIADGAGTYDVLYSREEMLVNKLAPPIKIPDLSGRNVGNIVWYPTRYNAFGETIITGSRPIVAPWEERAAGSLFFEIRPQDIHKFFEGMDRGGQGVAFLVDESGHLVSHSDRNILKAGRDMSFPAELKRMRGENPNGSKPHLSGYTGPDGKRVLFVYHHIPLTQWGVVVERKESEVYRMRNRLVRLTAGGFLGVILLVTPLAMLFAFRLTTPLAKLSDATKALALGDLSARSDVTSRDEIGELAGAFNQMAELRQKSEESLAQERERLSVTLRSVGDGVIATGIDGRVVLMNKVAETLTGWTQEEAADRPLKEVFHILNEKTRMICENPVEQVLRNGAIIGLANHTVLVARNGTERAIDDSGAPIHDRDNTIIGVILVFRDVTERRRAENAVRESEGKFRALFESAKDGILLLSSNGHVIALNTSFAMMHGWTVEEMLKMNLKDLDTPETAALAPERMQRLFAGETLTFEVEHYCRNGRTIPLEVSANMITINGEKYLLGFHRDITERKKGEEFIESILESVDEGFIIIDRDFRILSANKAYANMVAMPRDKIIGRNCYEVSHHAPAPCFGAGHDCAVKKAFETRSSQTSVHVHPDAKGGTYYVETKAYPLAKDGSGNIVTVIETLVDITEKRKLEDQLHQSQKMESIGTLAGGIAHDFNNILTAVIGYGNMVLMKMAKDDPQRLNIEHMLDAGDRAAHLTQDLLLFSRKQISERKPVDLNDIIRSVEKFLVRVIGEDVDCRTMLSSEAMPVLGDSHQLEQILMNLATNARDAMPAGGVFTITTELVRFDEEFITVHGYGKPGNYVLTTISDTGKGMDEETRGRIFEPFFTTKDVGKGTGLGLAVVYGIIKQHKGFINVYSEPGRGTTFKIYLPLIASDMIEEKKQVEEQPAGGTETILLAEDDETVRNLTMKVLEDFGYKVLTAIDGQDAVNKYKESKDRIQLLLFDIIMPRKTGKEAFDEISAMTPGMKVLFASGYAPDLVRQKVSIDDKVPVIFKPVSPMELLRQVRETLDK